MIFLAENVTFSARAQLLVSKLGRSSKPSPRYVVVVSTVVFSLVSTHFDDAIDVAFRQRKQFTSWLSTRKTALSKQCSSVRYL
jgi:hypothetical protein